MEEEELRKHVVMKQKTYDLVASQGDLRETFDSTISKMATYYLKNAKKEASR
jgi:hypothetical protein